MAGISKQGKYCEYVNDRECIIIAVPVSGRHAMKKAASLSPRLQVGLERKFSGSEMGLASHVESASRRAAMQGTQL